MNDIKKVEIDQITQELADTNVAPEGRQDEARFLFEFGREFDDGYYVDERDVDGIRVTLESYKTKHEPFVAFKVTDSTGLASQVFAYPDRFMINTRAGRGPWSEVDDLPELHSKAIHSTKDAIDEGKRISAQNEGVKQARKRGGGIIKLFRN